MIASSGSVELLNLTLKLLTVLIIGIGLKGQAMQQAQNISGYSHGTFINIRGIYYNQIATKKNLTAFFESAKQPTPQPISPSFNVPQQNSIFSVKTEPIAQPINSEEILKEETSKVLIDDNQEIRRKLEAVPDVIEDVELNERIRQISEVFVFEILKKEIRKPS